jgi:hypothetical protein
MAMPVLKVKGSLVSIPKTIVRHGKRWEQGPGAHTLEEVRKTKVYWEKLRRDTVFMIVKAVYEHWPNGSRKPVEGKFYFVYERRK